jgi:hypothetical protein
MSANTPHLLDRVRAALRRKHYSLRTKEAYVAWITRYILFHIKRHPQELGIVVVSLSILDEQIASDMHNM